MARTLEQEWEAALHKQRETQEEFKRFQKATPPHLTSAEREQIRALATNIPLLWNAPHSTPADRKEVIRCLVERVVLSVRGDTECVDATIHWAGGYVSQHAITRPVARYEQLENYDRITARIREGRAQGLTGAQIADQLNREGFRSPATRAGKFTRNIVNAIQNRLGTRKPLLTREKLAVNEWWLPELAAELKITTRRLYHWVRKGFVHARKGPASKFWILWADAEEIERLSRLRDYLRAERHIPYPKNLTQPKVQPIAKQ
ncbi:MAG: hypothetical protein KY475_10355 [Planctomycetes bacterium]|nr:hypothetical protein [Planctomycetota bacterium]